MKRKSSIQQGHGTSWLLLRKSRGPDLKVTSSSACSTQMAAPDVPRYGGVRAPIPGHMEDGHRELLEHITYHPAGESIWQYCNYVHDLCVITSQTAYEYEVFSNPLSIVEFILGGLPAEEPWVDIKIEFEDVVVTDVWAHLRPNETRYRNAQNGTYGINSGILRQRLGDLDQQWAAVAEDVESDISDGEEGVEEDLGDEDSDTDEEDEFMDEDINVDLAAQLFQEEVNATTEDEEPIEIVSDEDDEDDEDELAVVIDIDPEEIASLFPSDDDDEP